MKDEEVKVEEIEVELSYGGVVTYTPSVSRT